MILPKPFNWALRSILAATRGVGSNACTRPLGPTRRAASIEYAPRLEPTSNTVIPGRIKDRKRAASFFSFQPYTSAFSMPSLGLAIRSEEHTSELQSLRHLV